MTLLTTGNRRNGVGGYCQQSVSDELEATTPTMSPQCEAWRREDPLVSVTLNYTPASMKAFSSIAELRLIEGIAVAAGPVHWQRGLWNGCEYVMGRDLKPVAEGNSLTNSHPAIHQESNDTVALEEDEL